MNHQMKHRGDIFLGLAALLTFTFSVHAAFAGDRRATKNAHGNAAYFTFESRVRPTENPLEIETYAYKMKLGFHDIQEGQRLGNINGEQGWLQSHGACTDREFFGRRCKKGYVHFYNDTQENKDALKAVIIEGRLSEAKKSLEIFNQTRASKRIKTLMAEVEAKHGHKPLVQVSYRTDLRQSKSELIFELHAAGRSYTLFNRDISTLNSELVEEMIFHSFSRQKATIIHEIQFQQDVNNLVAETRAVERPDVAEVAKVNALPGTK